MLYGAQQIALKIMHTDTEAIDVIDVIVPLYQQSTARQFARLLALR